ncbi:MAG TPA: alpha/beta fold hydrolase [Chitinophagaceae bacterium]
MNNNNRSKKKFVSVLRWIGWVLLVQFVLMNISAAFYAYKFTHFYTNLPVEEGSPNIFQKTWKLFTGPKFQRSSINEQPVFPYQTIHLKTAKGLNIEAWYGQTDSAAKGTVILFHGITVSKTQMLEEAYEFRYWGYNVMLVDLRGHGNSETNITTIGARESEDVKLACDFVAQKGEKNILLFGSSLGAVVITKAIADYQLTPSGIIIEMPFLSLQAYLKGKARMLGFPQQPFAFLTTFWIGVEKGFNGFRHNTTRYAKKINCPVLMQVGAKDELVLQADSEKIFNAIASNDKKLIVYEKAQHESFLHHDPTRWRSEVEAFLKKIH